MVMTCVYFVEMKHWTDLQDHLSVHQLLLPEDLKGKTVRYCLPKVSAWLAQIDRASDLYSRGCWFKPLVRRYFYRQLISDNGSFVSHFFFRNQIGLVDSHMYFYGYSQVDKVQWFNLVSIFFRDIILKVKIKLKIVRLIDDLYLHVRSQSIED